MENPDLGAFGKYIPGFDFLQNLVSQAAGNVAPGLQSAAGALPALGNWVAPTFSVEELDKRIQDLRAVHFWLDQNTKALGATIQALEVQKMTLATLKGMNLSLQDVAESFKIRPEAAPAPAAEPEKPSFFKSSEPSKPEQPNPESPQAAVDPMQWWNSLTEQFTTIASGAMQDMAAQASKAAEQMAQSVQSGTETVEKTATPVRKRAAAPAAAKRTARADGAAKSTRAAPAKKAASAGRGKPKAGEGR